MYCAINSCGTNQANAYDEPASPISVSELVRRLTKSGTTVVLPIRLMPAPKKAKSRKSRMKLRRSLRDRAGSKIFAVELSKTIPCVFLNADVRHTGEF